ncbi:hypothetical protein LWI28_026655 [Acer negundo]|uniref:Retrotransposon gag domain-containing protein n=1 Tax=Acer negundo TaxID=4023 RepID=A0AAD5P6E8_ACENE|nr:hypothetical protein LWI28_026655 [Acer negundo]
MRNQEISMQMPEKNITILKNIERGHRRSEPQASAESQHSSSRPRVERDHSRSTPQRHAKNKRRTRQRSCAVEVNDSRHSRYLHDHLKRLKECILGMQRNQTDNRNPDPLVELQSPFVVRIRKAITHRRFEMPQIPHYEGHSDPVIHMQLYRGLMEVRGASEDVMCKFFPLTEARSLERKPNVLRDIKQGESETLKKYVKRFHKEVINLGAYDEENTLKDSIKNIRICQLWFNFQDFRPKDYTKAYERALHFIETVEQLRLKKVIERAEYGSKKEKGKDREENQGDRNSRPMITGGIPRLQHRGRDQLKAPILQPQPVMNVPNETHPETFRRTRTWNSKYVNYHALNAIWEQILIAIYETGLKRGRSVRKAIPIRRRNAHVNHGLRHPSIHSSGTLPLRASFSASTIAFIPKRTIFSFSEVALIALRASLSISTPILNFGSDPHRPKSISLDFGGNLGLLFLPQPS